MFKNKVSHVFVCKILLLFLICLFM